MTSHGNMKRRLLNWSANLLAPYQRSEAPTSGMKQIPFISIGSYPLRFNVRESDNHDWLIEMLLVSRNPAFGRVDIIIS
jgi:hypothetical protein